MSIGIISSLAVAGVDADGDLDLLAANSNNGVASTMRGAQQLPGGFGRQPTGEYRAQPPGLVLGSMAAEGDLDLLTSKGLGNSVSVRFNGGTGPLPQPRHRLSAAHRAARCHERRTARRTGLSARQAAGQSFNFNVRACCVAGRAGRGLQPGLFCGWGVSGWVASSASR
ncbi:hypothetical protein [Hymenobacter rubidus]|uniref:hypothetical protein n=1 Tax=Hymenobacter rubidus TaxID=1441626 RepID=UPI00191FB8BC|nr:hypothetical protein [Hymenobacter rubidus]